MVGRFERDGGAGDQDGELIGGKIKCGSEYEM